MLRILRQGQRWILWFVIVVVGGVFVIYLGLPGLGGGAGDGGAVVEVDGRRYFVQDLMRVREVQEENFRRALGAGYNPESVAEILDQGAARSLAQQAILAGEAERLGLRVTDREVRDYLRTIPGAADAQGRLDRAVLTNYAEREFGSVRRFQETLRDELLARKVRLLLYEAVDVSRAEAREVLRQQDEEVEIAYVVFDPERLKADIEVSDEQVSALLESDPERARRSYEERIADFDRPETVRARHILLRIPPDADDAKRAEVRERAEAIRERLAAGEDFAELARELSEDPGSADQGGDLGFVARGTMAPAFEQMAFALQPGEPSEIVTTTYGLHVLRVEERRTAETTSFEDARESLAREIVLEEQAAQAASAQAEALAAAVRGGRSLIDAARDAGLTVERPDALRRRPDGRVPGLGPATEVLTAAFTLTPDAPSPDRVFDVDGKQVLIELLARRAPDEESLTPRIEELREQLLSQRRSDAERAWLADRESELREAGKIQIDLAALRTR